MNALLPQRLIFFDDKSADKTNRKFVVGCGDDHLVIVYNNSITHPAPPAQNILNTNPPFETLNMVLVQKYVEDLSPFATFTQKVVDFFTPAPSLTSSSAALTTSVGHRHHQTNESDDNLQKFVYFLEKSFRNPSILNASFLANNHRETGLHKCIFT